MMSLCIRCAKKSNCMPYDDETLERGAKEGHTPASEEDCEYYIAERQIDREGE